MRRFMILIILMLSITGLWGCGYLSWTFPPISVSSETTVLPTFTTGDGTITLVNSDYLYYEAYSSPAYSLTDIEEYNELLLTTRDLIRSANIQIQTTIYQTRIIWPGMNQTTILNTVTGSGILFREDETYYYLLTNHHVVDPGADQAEYAVEAFGDAEPGIGELVCFNAEEDMAVLRFLKNGRTGLHLVSLVPRLFRQMNEGELVMAVGNPSGLENNVTFGEFVGFRTLEGHTLPIIEHTAPISNGSSGGALVDVDGNLLGMNTWGSDEDDTQSYAITVYEIFVFLFNNGLA